jgi:hypothetical protein
VFTYNAALTFSAATRAALARKGITITRTQAIPGFEGDRYFSGTAYVLNDNGTQRVRSFNEVLTLSGRTGAR